MDNKSQRKQRIGLRFAIGLILISSLAGLVGAMMQGPMTPDPMMQGPMTPDPMMQGSKGYEFKTVDFPAQPGSGEPYLAEDPEGRVFASWIEKHEDKTSSLLFSRLSDSADSWSTPTTIARGENWFVNWADVPSIAVGSQGRMAAHWLEGLGSGRYAYGVRIVFSYDFGKSWTDPAWLHEDESSSEHGFAAMAFAPDGALDVVWLDGRNMATGGGMMIMSRRIATDGSFGDEFIIDDRTCECCPTSITHLADGSLISAFRDRSENEIRDIHVRKFDGTRWIADEWSTNDGWKIAACPVNGPVVQAEGSDVVLAWFTAPDDEPSVNISFSDDGGMSFSDGVRLNENRAIGRVGLSLIKDGRAVVTWIESGASKAAANKIDPATGKQTPSEAGIKMRIVHADGTLESTIVVASTASSRSSGYPRIATQGETLVFLWTQVGDQNKVVSSVGIPSL